MRFDFDLRKSERLRANRKRGIGFEEAQEIFAQPYYMDQRSEQPEQYRDIGRVGDKLFTLIFGKTKGVRFSILLGFGNQLGRSD